MSTRVSKILMPVARFMAAFLIAVPFIAIVTFTLMFMFVGLRSLLGYDGAIAGVVLGIGIGLFLFLYTTRSLYLWLQNRSRNSSLVRNASTGRRRAAAQSIRQRRESAR